ncbi:MAG TPA: polysaccharide biosynthesis tyrosine autokinase [Vicinamibacteria bacterium]|nr:polysaccharide biosynthesis tyrosine autokinase [Vicinamibacteria bacterium]
MTSLVPPAPPAPAESSVDVRFYAHLLWRGRALIATAAVVGLAVGLLVAYLQTPEYRAAAMLQIEPPTPTFLSVTDALVGGGNYWQHADFYNTEFKVLRSKGMGERAVLALKLADRAPFKDAPDAGGLFMGHVTIDPVPESRLVLLQVTHQDPKEAALWANTLADVYLEYSVGKRVESARKAYDWLQERLAVTQQSMRDAQDELFKSYQTQDLFVPDGSISAVSASITRLNDDYIEAQARRISLEAALKQADQMRARGQSLDAVPQVAVDDLVGSLNSQLATLNLDLSRLKEKYLAGHPEVQKVQAQVDQIRKAKDDRAAQIVAGLRAEYAQLQRREAELRVAIDAQKAQAATQSRKGAELDALRKESDSSKNLYEVLLQKLNETDIAASMRNDNVSMVERASPPLHPVRPEKKKIAGLALVLGLVLGVGLVLGRDFFDNTVKDPEEMERYLHLDLLAAVPRYDESTVHLVTEAYQNLRTALIFARKEETGQVVLVTSTAPQEGKTTTLVNIAKLLASSGEKTLVVDFDLRRAQLHSRLGLTREPGVTGFFVKHEDLDTLIRPTRVPNLFALTAGPLPPNPPALLARRAVADLFDHLRRHFEWVLVDSPPLASVTDALLVARHADMAVYVVHHNKIDKRLAKRSVAALRRATPNLLGAVLNAVDIKAKGYYYYYYQQDTGTPARSAAAAKPRGPTPVAARK